MPVLDHVRKGLVFLDFAGKGQKRRPHGIVELGIGHHHVEDWLRVFCNCIPNPDRLEESSSGSGNGRGARIFRLGMRQRGVNDRHREWIAQSLP
jgi:hypothetical protein